jgi:hypothetical protein
MTRPYKAPSRPNPLVLPGFLAPMFGQSPKIGAENGGVDHALRATAFWSFERRRSQAVSASRNHLVAGARPRLVAS